MAEIEPKKPTPRFTVIHPTKVIVGGGNMDATLIQHEYQDPTDLLKDLEHFPLFQENRCEIAKWLENARAGMKQTLKRGHVEIVLLCHRGHRHQPVKG